MTMTGVNKWISDFLHSMSQEGYWGSSYNDSGGVPKLQVYPCPSTYCRCFDPEAVVGELSSCRYALHGENPNDQCSCNRTGMYACVHVCSYNLILLIFFKVTQLVPPLQTKGFLCGKCAASNGVSTAFNRCVPCSFATVALIPALSESPDMWWCDTAGVDELVSKWSNIENSIQTLCQPTAAFSE